MIVASDREPFQSAIPPSDTGLAVRTAPDTLRPMNAVDARADATPDSESGDPSALVAQLGLPESPASLSGFRTGSQPEVLLAMLRDEVIRRTEWPAILRAAELARQGHHRELLELDDAFGRGLPPELARASCCVGRHQLSRLRALRDQRVIQRYLDAIDGGRARGWNPIVYGIVLAVFGIPLRQGLVHYANSILRSHAAHFGSGAAPLERLLADAVEPLPRAANLLMDSSGFPSLRTV